MLRDSAHTYPLFGLLYFLTAYAHLISGSGQCSTDLHISRVALLFLARGGMPLEELWKAWFHSATGVVPIKYVRQQICDSHEAASVHPFDCQLGNENDGILAQQLLFSVYVHSSRINFTSFEPSSVFFGTLLAKQGAAEWGDTTPAVKLLLEESLKDYRNAVFALLSDSDVPLYPAKLTYHQLIQERVSRVDACHAYDLVNLHRYTCAMAEDGIDLQHWRKSNLFMLLIRKHAEMFRDEQRVYQSFKEKCSGVRVDEALATFRGCLTDEHYYASYLAAMGLSHETDCIGAITLANFRNSVAGHPKTYNDSDVDSELLTRLRTTITWLPRGKCANQRTYETAATSFLELPSRDEQLDCEQILARPDMPLMDSVCHMFYRKFDRSAVPELIKLMRSRAGDTSVLGR